MGALLVGENHHPDTKTPSGSRTCSARRHTRRRLWGHRSAWCLGVWVVILSAGGARAQDPFADAVVSFMPGASAGFGQEDLPDIVLGPPRGGGALQQSLDTLSLGNDGVLTLRFDVPVICDGPGPDLTVFENAFHSGTVTGPVFEEYGIVAVSQDGEHFVEFAYDPVTHAGLAGRVPVLSNPDNDIDPLDPRVSGGDQYDLADLGLTWVAYVRITDPGDAIDDPGNHIPPGDKGGFDLDALAALHACDPSAIATPTSTAGEATPAQTVTSTPTATAIVNATAADTVTATVPSTAADTATPTATAIVTATATALPLLPGDLDADGDVDGIDLELLIDAVYGDVATPSADVNGDGVITAADVTALLGHWAP